MAIKRVMKNRAKLTLGNFLALVLLTLWLFVPRSAPALNIPLTVENSTPDLVRTSEPVTIGIPLPEEAQITDVGALALVASDGRPVPAQFSPLARWHAPLDDLSKPLRWVLVDFRADVAPYASSMYSLTDEKENPTPADPVRLTSRENALVVDTGVAEFLVKGTIFNFFDKVVLKRYGGLKQATVLSQNGKGGLELRDAQGKIFNSLNQPPESVEVEETGPLRTVIRVRGVFRSSSGDYFAEALKNSPDYPRFTQPYEHSFFYYDCRMHFYAGKSYVRILLTIENNGANGRTNPEQNYAPVQAVVFDKLEAVFLLPTISTLEVAAEGLQESLKSEDHLLVYQDWRENLADPKKGTLEPTFEKGPFFQVSKNGLVLSDGARHSGWVHLASPEGMSLGLGMLHFWQNFPKKIQVSPRELRLGLWPEEGYYPYCRSDDFPDPQYDLYCRRAGRTPRLYLFDAGRHKTHEFIVDFGRQKTTDSTKLKALALERPLTAKAPPEWYAETKSLGLIAEAGLESGDPQLKEAFSRFDLLQKSVMDSKVSENGWTIDALRTKNPPHWNYSRQNRFFGWMHFGDLLWSGQVPSALHYDWCYGMTLNYIRTGERGFFDAARELCRHRYDIDQYHGERTDTQGNHKWINHMAFYETEGHADPTLTAYMPSRVAGPSHTWNGGLVLWYLLTGDRKAFEAAREVGQGAMNYFASGGLKDATKQGCASEETRSETWPMLNLIHLYRVTGDPQTLAVAHNIAKNRILYREQKAGSQGYFGMGNDCEAIVTGQQYNTMYSYALDPIIQIHYETKDDELKQLILRMADFMKEKYLFGGDYNAEGLYRPLQSLYVWVEEDPDGSRSGKTGEPVKDTFNGDLFAYAYKLSGNPEYLQWARQSFRDTVFYYTVKGSTYISPSYRAKLSFIDEMFSGTETKVHGWLGRTNQIYLSVEKDAFMGRGR